MGDSARVFVALHLPSEMVEALRISIGQLRSTEAASGIKASWTGEPHLTLSFLGKVPVQRLEGADLLLQQASASVPPIQLQITKLGGFPSLVRPKIIWFGVSGDLKVLRSLQTKVSDVFGSLGSHTEDKAYNPHITLARIRDGDRSALRTFTTGLEPLRDIELGACVCDRIDLVQSQLSRTGARYRILASASLLGLSDENLPMSQNVVNLP